MPYGNQHEEGQSPLRRGQKGDHEKARPLAQLGRRNSADCIRFRFHRNDDRVVPIDGDLWRPPH